MDPRVLYASDDTSWLERPDSEVEGPWIERKEWCTADEIAAQISAFANGQPPGGLFVLGVRKDGSVLGVRARQAAVDERLAQLNHLVDSCGWQHRFVPVCGDQDHIVYILVPASAGRVVCLSGGRAFKRLGASTVAISEEEIRELRYSRHERSFEDEPAAPFSGELLAPDLARAFLEGILKRNGLTLPLTLEEALANKGLLVAPASGPALSFAALLAMGKRPHDFLAGAKVRFQRFEGTKEDFGSSRNVVKDRWFEGPIPALVVELREFMRTQVREFDYLGPEGRFVTDPEYPEFAWEEAVVNALVHRSYSLGAVAVFVRMFDDRIEVDSPGGFGAARPDSKGEFPFSDPRNPRLAVALQYFELVRLAKEGTRRMHVEMKKLNLPPPVFEELRGPQVRVTLFNDVERRRNRVGDEEARQKWMGIEKDLRDDLQIYRQRGLDSWGELARGGAIAPGGVLDAAEMLVRESSALVNERQKALELMASGRDPNHIRQRISGLVRDVLAGRIQLDRNVVGSLASTGARFDETALESLEWLEAEPRTGHAVATALGILNSWLYLRESLPPRDQLDRILGVCRAYATEPAAGQLFEKITGRPIVPQT